MEDYGYIKRNLEELTLELRELAESLGRPAPTLVAVTKSGSDEELLALVRAGATDIGENRPQELARRNELIRAAGLSARMHEIGTLQRNKVKLISEFVDTVHSVDSLRLAEELNRHAERLGRKIPVLIEVNSGREEQKGGVPPEDCEALIKELNTLKSIDISGLMTMGPARDDPEELRPCFRETRELFERLKPYFATDKPTLSMGMSDSYRVAVEEGSTLVRVGRRLFKKD